MLDRLNRRQFFRVAAGAMVAAVAAPEMVRAEGQKFWQLDRTMVVPRGRGARATVVFIDEYAEAPDFDWLLRKKMMEMKLDLERCIIFGDQSPFDAPTMEILEPAVVGEEVYYNNFLTELSGVGANPFYVEAVNRVAEGQRNELEGLRGHAERGVLRRTSPDEQPYARRSRRDLFGRNGILALVSGDGLPRDEARDRLDG